MMSDKDSFGGRGWIRALAVFAAVVLAQLWLVAGAGTDVPFMEQWDVEGGWLYPAWHDGTLKWSDLFKPHNGHRIVWTHLWNLGLFVMNDGKWDPLVQLVANAFLRAAGAALLVMIPWRNMTSRARGVWAAAVAVGFLPLIAWHNVVWGFQSQVAFTVALSAGAIGVLSRRCAAESCRDAALGITLGVVAMLAMGPGLLVPVALLALGGVRWFEGRARAVAAWKGAWPAVLLLGLALVLRDGSGGAGGLSAASGGDFFNALGRGLAWPHTGAPWAALVMSLPLLILVTWRLMGCEAPRTELADLWLALAFWGVALATAAAWTRSGSGEFAAGAPSRYADFLVILPLANAGCALLVVGHAYGKMKRRGRLAAGVWLLFAGLGWITLSVEAYRRVVGPRMRDLDAPVRLLVEFQRNGDAGVFEGRPRLLVPHPNVESVRRVLNDPRMEGSLPPSLQPERPLGPLSQVVRALLGREE